jgi:hypothetical protein
MRAGFERAMVAIGKAKREGSDGATAKYLKECRFGTLQLRRRRILAQAHAHGCESPRFSEHGGDDGGRFRRARAASAAARDLDAEQVERGN